MSTREDGDRDADVEGHDGEHQLVREHELQHVQQRMAQVIELVRCCGTFGRSVQARARMSSRTRARHYTTRHDTYGSLMPGRTACLARIRSSSLMRKVASSSYAMLSMNKAIIDSE